MLFATPKWTTQVVATSVAWMGQEKDPAVSAAGQASAKERLGPQHGPEDEIVLQHESADACLAVPVRPKLETLLDFDAQKPSVSLMMLMCLGMLRPTRSARRVSRGRTKLFSAVLRLPLLLGNEMLGGSAYLSRGGVNYPERYRSLPGANFISIPKSAFGGLAMIFTSDITPSTS